MADWHLVLNREGVVLGATEGAPASWVGTRLDERDDAPEDLKEAGRRILDSARQRAAPVAASVPVPSLGPGVHVTVIDALPLRRVATDLRALLRSTLDVLQRQAKACDVALTIVVDGQVPAMVVLDAEKIAWATTVLVGNALRYVRHGSRAMPGGSIAVRVTYSPVDDEVTIAVEDDGAGIPAETLPFLFKAGPDHRPAGLALSMVRDVVTAHAGHIDVHSDPNTFPRGTTIWLTLPVG